MVRSDQRRRGSSTCGSTEERSRNPKSEIDALWKGSRLTAGMLAKAAAERTDAEKNDLYQLVAGDSSDADISRIALRKASRHWKAEQNTLIKQRGTVGLVMNEKNEEAMAYVLYRGESTISVVIRSNPATPVASYQNSRESSPKQSTGARSVVAWIQAHPSDKRVSRSTVSGKKCSGPESSKLRGISALPGELPVESAELLDWLADRVPQTGCPEFEVAVGFDDRFNPVGCETDSSVFLVTSSTYRQSADWRRRRKIEKDPQQSTLCREALGSGWTPK